MKKIICLLMSLLMLLCGSALAETNDVTGVWYGNLFGIVCTLTMNTDGTYQVEFAEEESVTPQQGTWVQSGGSALILDEGTDNELILTMPADMLMLSHGGLNFFFTREMPAVFVPAAVNPDVSLEQFAGQWSMTHLTSMGLLFDANTLGIQISMNISGSDAEVFLCSTTMEAEFSENSPPVLAPVSSYTADMSGVFEGGVLTLTELLPDPAAAETDDAVSPAATAEPPVPMVWQLQLLEDGSMCITDAAEPDYPVFMYMTPIMPLTLE